MQKHSDSEYVYLYTRFERFWHWTQAVLIIALLITGLEVHGTYHLLGFQNAVEIHNGLGIAWLVLYTFILFWQVTTGEWKHYIPTTKHLAQVFVYYLKGIFLREPHPAPKGPDAKLNPLQRLTYLGVAIFLIPFQMITGILYYTYNHWTSWGITASLETVATLHQAGAFLLLAFLIVHMYLTTTGHSLFCHMKAMCTGWEEVPKKTK